MSDNIPWELLGRLYDEYEQRFAEILVGQGEVSLYFGISVSPETEAEQVHNPPEYRLGGSPYGVVGMAFDQTESTGNENPSTDEEVSYEELQEMLPPTLRTLTEMQMEITEILREEGYPLSATLRAISGTAIQINPSFHTNMNSMSVSCCKHNGRWHKRYRVNYKTYCTNTPC